MRKSIIALSIAAMALTAATPALANNGNHNGEDRGLKLGKILERFEKQSDKLEKRLEKQVPADSFVLTGVIGSTTSASIVVTVKSSVHVPTITNSLATVNVDSNTKIHGDKNQTLAIADLKTGQQVVASGTVSGSTLTAKNIHVIFPKGKAYGEVTAKTDTSITIKNNVTGVSQTYTTSGDTKVSINGEAKTTADVHIGDKGFVKFKASITGFFARAIRLFR